MATMTMNISLPAPMKEYIEEQVSGGGYNTASEYFRELVREDQKRKAQERLEVLLLQRLENKDERVFNVEEVRKELAKRLKKEKKRRA